jgi:tRNA (cmo5U34)-methyltransferase
MLSPSGPPVTSLYRPRSGAARPGARGLAPCATIGDMSTEQHPPGAAWQRPEIAAAFVDARRRLVPYGEDQLAMLLHLVRRFRPAPGLLLDLGCGDGTVARAVMEAWPETRALLVDFSEPMLERAREAMAAFSNRCEIREADLREPISGLAPAGGVDLVVSGYAIHHLPDDRKRSLYAEVHHLLAPGGLFVNLEHVASASPALEALWDDLFIDHQAAVSGRSREEVSREYHGRPDRLDNILAPVEEQLRWLREIGFLHADCYFKWLELAVFGGVRDGAVPDGR